MLRWMGDDHESERKAWKYVEMTVEVIRKRNDCAFDKSWYAVQ